MNSSVGIYLLKILTGRNFYIKNLPFSVSLDIKWSEETYELSHKKRSYIRNSIDHDYLRFKSYTFLAIL